MNCQEFRQHCASEPNCQEKEFLSHQHNCLTCAAFVEQLIRFEPFLVEAIQVEAPPGLSQRILHRHQNYSQKSSYRRRFIYALAASLLVLISLVGIWWWQPDTIAMPQKIIAYIENEPLSFKTDGEVSSEELRRMFKMIGAELTGEVGKASFCKVLTFEGHMSAQLVLIGTRGPVNVLFILDSQINERQSFRSNKLEGILLPAVWGNIAIVGAPEEPLEKVANRLNEAIRWL